MPARALERARELYERGWAEQAKFRFPSAIRFLKRALVHVERAAPSQERAATRARILYTLGLCQGETSGMDIAVEAFDAARREIETIEDTATRTLLNAGVDHNHGLMVMRMGQPERAVEWFNRFIEAVEHDVERTSPGANRALVQGFVSTLLNRGFALAAVRRSERAAADLERGIQLAREHELHHLYPFGVHALGNVHKQSGDLAAALRRYEEAERIFREDEQPGLLARLQLDQAEAMLMIGLSDEAGKHLDEALPVMRKEKFGQEIAEVEMFRASAALLDDQLDLARRMAKRSERKLVRRGSTWWMMAGLIELWAHGRHAMHTGRISNALVQKALALSDELAANHLVDESRLALLLATRLEIRRGRLVEAEELLKRVPGPRTVTPLDHRMQRRLVLAELALAKGSRRAALTHARQALDELGRVRDQLGGLELVSATAVHGRELSELAIKLALEDADARRLFAWLERTRAQTYRYEPLEATDNNEVAERITEVRNLSWAILRHGLSGQPTAELRGKLVKAQREANRLGWHSQRWGKPRPVAGIREVIAELGERAMVSYVVSGGEIAAVVVAGGRVRLERLGHAAEALESAQKLHFDLNALAPDHLPPPLVQVIGASAHKQADRLDTLLIKPLRHLIGDRELVVVPTGTLYAVPWGVIPGLHGRPVVTAPSATAWLAAAQGGEVRTDRVLVVQGPGLLFGHDEVDKLATYHANVTMLSGNTATAAEVLAHLDGADLVHVAAHGEHETENALFSRLELVDGPLFAHELGRLRKPPAHVVLAACELALNRIRPGDEALGFAGAMLAGGTRTVVAAASKVGDEASAAAMADYHRALVAGAAPAVALAEAMAKDPFRRPFLCLGSG
ncbi:CHAT domain-containing protein [Lentzea sp. DG1S-22]|uniref:CHAT domain-containing protein n=1 Tax=Lentzea sp. DG1S-22 TaxID=3108822 RepID=UPI002E7A30F8|nr:CHAT domain-containing protein [Lentzea sp. DG1S-22]WVH80143.1 CHAT domain-containing protein [Lentzea sp. DG1S-22]